MEGNEDDDLYGDLLTGHTEEGQGHYRAKAEEVCTHSSSAEHPTELRRLSGQQYSFLALAADKQAASYGGANAAITNPT